MNPAFFFEQWQRLKNKFGRNMDDELKLLAADVVAEMSETGFKRAVDTWIGSKTVNKPPLLAEFREVQLAEVQRKLANDASGAVRTLRHPDVVKPLREVLLRDFGGVDSAKEALKVAIYKRRTAAADEPPEGA